MRIFPFVQFVIFDGSREIIEDRLCHVRLVRRRADLDQLHPPAEALTAGTFARNILLQNFERLPLLPFAKGLHRGNISICQLARPPRA